MKELAGLKEFEDIALLIGGVYRRGVEEGHRFSKTGTEPDVKETADFLSQITAEITKTAFDILQEVLQDD